MPDYKSKLFSKFGRLAVHINAKKNTLTKNLNISSDQI